MEYEVRQCTAVALSQAKDAPSNSSSNLSFTRALSEGTYMCTTQLSFSSQLFQQASSAPIPGSKPKGTVSDIGFCYGVSLGLTSKLTEKAQGIVCLNHKPMTRCQRASQDRKHLNESMVRAGLLVGSPQGASNASLLHTPPVMVTGQQIGQIFAFVNHCFLKHSQHFED